MNHVSNNKLKISIFTTKWGHYSIAKAAEDILSINHDYKLYLNDIRMEKISEKSYMFFYRLFPPLFKIPFKAAEQEEISKIIRKYLGKKYEKDVAQALEKQKPDVVINTYFAFNSTITKYSKKHNSLFINIVPDPRSINKLIISRSCYNFVFDKKARNICRKFGIDKDKIITSGWFVRKEYRKEYSSDEARTKLGIPKEDLVFVVVGGTSGTYGMLKVLPALIRPKRPVTVMFICGESKTLYRSVKVFSEAFSSKKLTVIPLGYKSNLYDYLRATDLVIGKAGPNLIFETGATHTPFLAVSHISGQESGNLEIIKKYKIGYVEENNAKVIRLLRNIIKNPNQLNRFKKSIDKMAEYNANAGKVLTDFVEEKTKT
jgi:UDP-N-acetylglucosamine:LPS N-acetylglucosamine transferase